MDLLSIRLSPAIDGPVMVHSSLLGMLKCLNIDVRKAIADIDKNHELMDEFLRKLMVLIGDRDLWIPAFNYDFGTTGVYDVQKSPSQVGALPEFFRTKKAEWRSEIPLFSHCGRGKRPTAPRNDVIDPVGIESDFHELVQRNGTLLFYSVPFSPTHTHYVERVTGAGPLYRYDKYYRGKMINNGQETQIRMCYHVRPPDITPRYNMPFLFQELIAQGLMRKLPDDYPNTYAIAAAELTEYWSTQIQKDPFYLLHPDSRKILGSLVEKKGGRLQIEDFDDHHLGLDAL